MGSMIEDEVSAHPISDNNYCKIYINSNKYCEVIFFLKKIQNQ